MKTSEIRLTQTVQKGGCAAKVSATELRHILAKVKFPEKNASLLVDGSLFDDAAIYKVNDSLALVQTLDFFTPIVDTPRLFGRIACANALSDVYAMGGTPKTAMAILAFPIASLSNEIIAEVLQGACDVLSEVQVPLIGGHSIDDDTLKFGLSVTGYVDPKKIWSNSGAKSGDVLILTKGLGTGTITAGLKRSELSESDISEALSSMCQLNQILDLLSDDLQIGIHAATDITGFGFLGHSMQMAKASQKSFSIKCDQVPALPKARQCLEKSFLTKAHRTNKDYVNQNVSWGRVDELTSLLLLDPQTSGGLLLAVDASKASEINKALQLRFQQSSIVGYVESESNHVIELT